MNSCSFSPTRSLIFLALALVPLNASASNLPMELQLDESFCAADGIKGDRILNLKVAEEQLCQFVRDWFDERNSNARTNEIPTVLRPRIAELSAALGGMWSGNLRNIDMALEWTIIDESGAILWVDTVQVDVSGKVGNAFKMKKRFREDFKTLLEAIRVESEASFQSWHYFF